MGGVGGGISTASGEASAVFGGEENNANGINSTILGGQKNTISSTSNDSSIVGGEDNNIVTGASNSVVLGGIGLLGGGFNQTVCGVANESMNNSKFIVGVGSYNSSTDIVRKNGLAVLDTGQIQLDQYSSMTPNNDITSLSELRIAPDGKVYKGDFQAMANNAKRTLAPKSYGVGAGDNINLGLDIVEFVRVSYSGVDGTATITLPNSTNALGRIITIYTTASSGTTGNKIVGVKAGGGDNINGIAGPNIVSVLDKSYDSVQLFADVDGWVVLRTTSN